MTQPTPQQVDPLHLLAAFGQELNRVNDSRIYLMGLVAQQAEQIEQLQAELQNATAATIEDTEHAEKPLTTDLR